MLESVPVTHQYYCKWSFLVQENNKLSKNGSEGARSFKSNLLNTSQALQTLDLGVHKPFSYSYKQKNNPKYDIVFQTDNLLGPSDPVRVPTAILEDEEEDQLGFLGTTEFAVTRDFGIHINRPISIDNQGPHSPKARRKLDMRENIENRNQYSDTNFHELSV